MDAIAEAGHFVSEVDAVSTHVRVKCSFSTYERVPVMSTFHAVIVAHALAMQRAASIPTENTIE